MTDAAPPLTIHATKPYGRLAGRLADLGLRVRGVADDEGNVDRYVLSKRLAVERRTGSSFLRGILDKTLFTSAVYLREHFRIPLLIVEGKVNYEHSAFNPQAVRGAMTAMVLEYGLSVLASPEVDETAALIAMLARQEQTGIPAISLIPKRKAVGLADQQRRVVEMLPGSGMVMARQLLQHFGSVRRIANADEDELRAVRGIGARKAAEIVNVLGAEYEAVDTERDLEDAIEAEPGLLFEGEVALLARQHHIYTDEKDRHVVDMVFLDRSAGEVVLVELKRGRLGREHAAQLQRYLDHAGQSRLLRKHLSDGAALRGVLATTEPGGFVPKDTAMSVRIVDRQAAIAVLKRLRRQRQ